MIRKQEIPADSHELLTAVNEILDEILDNTMKSLVNTLDDFLNATETSTMKSLAKKLEPYYDGYDYFYNDLFLTTKVRINQVSPLEIVAESKKLKHLNLLLNLKYSNKSLPLELKNDMINAFFRALEKGHTNVILSLLEYPIVKDTVVKIKILSSIDSLYIRKITKPSYHPFRYNNDIKPQGNIALIMAAALPDSSIFDHLLQNFPLIKEQLSESALGAFLSATRTAQGTPKKLINETIINQLLEFPHVYEYVSKREFDFGDLLRDFDKLKTKNTKAPKKGFCERFLGRIKYSNELPELRERFFRSIKYSNELPELSELNELPELNELSDLNKINLTYASPRAVTERESPFNK